MAAGQRVPLETVVPPFGKESLASAAVYPAVQGPLSTRIGAFFLFSVIYFVIQRLGVTPCGL